MEAQETATPPPPEPSPASNAMSEDSVTPGATEPEGLMEVGTPKPPPCLDIKHGQELGDQLLPSERAEMEARKSSKGNSLFSFVSILFVVGESKKAEAPTSETPEVIALASSC